MPVIETLNQQIVLRLNHKQHSKKTTEEAVFYLIMIFKIKVIQREIEDVNLNS